MHPTYCCVFKCVARTEPESSPWETEQRRVQVRVPSRVHGADWNNDDQDHSTGCSYNQSSNFTDFSPPELCVLLVEQRVITWRVDVLHPVLQAVGVQALLNLIKQTDGRKKRSQGFQLMSESMQCWVL